VARRSRSMKKFNAPSGIEAVTFWLAAKWEVILIP